ncbi:MAG TPA: helix-turn-helix domain-containing protein [Polyangiaceae bacterium]|nr:helix-turn-helix domain-containing protein [Polyangiaceae bacterium]
MASSPRAGSRARLPVGEIAYLLGYSEPGTFTTAFNRWTGVSPSEHRAARR